MYECRLTPGGGWLTPGEGEPDPFVAVFIQEIRWAPARHPKNAPGCSKKVRHVSSNPRDVGRGASCLALLEGCRPCLGAQTRLNSGPGPVTMNDPDARSLVIFDCDGVLVDSEILACDIQARALS